MINYQGILFATVYCALAAGQPHAPKQGSNSPITKPAGQQNLTDSIILTLIYHKLEKADHDWDLRNHGKYYSPVSADSTQFSDKHWKDMDATQINYYVEYVEEIKEDSSTKYLVILGGSGMSCHVCPGVCAGAVFVRAGDDWKLETYENDIAVLGQTGYPVNEVSVTQLYDGMCAIILKNGGDWFGENWRYFTLVLYDHGSFKEGFEKPVTFSSDNWSNAEGDYYTAAYAYTSSMLFVPGGQQYDDLVLHYQGTVHDKELDKPVILDRSVRFKYKNGQYTTTDKLPDE